MAQTLVEPTSPPPRTGRPSGVAGLVGAGTAIAVLVAAGLTGLAGTRPLTSLGLPDPGMLTTVGLPAVRAVTEISMVLTIGGLLLAAFLVPPQRSGYLDVAGYRALRATPFSTEHAARRHEPFSQTSLYEHTASPQEQVPGSNRGEPSSLQSSAAESSKTQAVLSIANALNGIL